MRKLTEADLHKEIRNNTGSEGVLRGICGDNLWIQLPGLEMETWSNLRSSWEVVEEKCADTPLYRCPHCIPAEPKKETIAEEVFHRIQGFWAPYTGNVTNFKPEDSAAYANKRIDALIEVLDEKFKEME